MAEEEDIVQRIRVEGEGDLLTIFERIGAAGQVAFREIGTAARQVGSAFAKVQQDAKTTYQALNAGAADGQSRLKKLELTARQFGTSIRNLGGSLKTSFTNAFQSLSGSDGFDVSVFRRAATQISTSFETARTRVNAAIAAINTSFRNFQPSRFRDGLKGVEAAAYAFGSSLRGVGSGIAGFARRLTLIGGGAAAAIAALRALTSSVTGAAQAERVASRERLADIRDEKGDRTGLYNIQQQAAEAQRKLTTDMGRGKLTTEQYTEALQDLQEQTRSNIRTFFQQDAAEEEARRRQFEAMKRLREQEAFDNVADKVGNQAAGAFFRLGTAIEQVTTRMKQILGPVLADVIGSLADVVQKNQGKIAEFFQEVRKELQPIASEIKGTFKDALPEALNFVRGLVSGIKIVAGMVKGLLATFNAVAAGINAIFGTQLSGSGLAGVAVILQLSGAFKVIVPLIAAAGKGLGVLFRALTGFSAVTTIIRTIAIAIGGLVGVFGAIPIAITAIVVAIGVWLAYSGKLQAAWSAVSSFFVNLWNNIKSNASSSASTVSSAWNAVVTFFQNLPGTLSGLVSGLWNTIKNAAGAAVQYVINRWNGIVTFFQGLPALIGQAASSLWTMIQTAAGQAVDWIVNKWNEVIAWFQNLPSALGEFVGGIWDKIKQGAQSAVDGVISVWNGIIGRIQSVFNQIKQAAKEVWDSIPKGLRDLISGAVSLFSGGGGAVAAAGGGHIRGPGGPTSDRIPAWLSDGEFVQRAAAVRKYGVNFMRSINNLTFDPTRFAERFAMGGLVGGGAPVIKMADGGLANNLRNVLNLTLDGETFSGLRSDDDTMERLKKHAVKKAISPRKPNWMSKNA